MRAPGEYGRASSFLLPTALGEKRATAPVFRSVVTKERRESTRAHFGGNFEWETHACTDSRCFFVCV